MQKLFSTRKEKERQLYFWFTKSINLFNTVTKKFKRTIQNANQWHLPPLASLNGKRVEFEIQPSSCAPY